MPITEKQKRFCHYLIEQKMQDAARAAERVGYSMKYLKQTAWGLRRFLEVKQVPEEVQASAIVHNTLSLESLVPNMKASADELIKSGDHKSAANIEAAPYWCHGFGPTSRV